MHLGRLYSGRPSLPPLALTSCLLDQRVAHGGVPGLVRTHDGVRPAMDIGTARHDAPGALRSKGPRLHVAETRVDGFANLIGTRLRSPHDAGGAVGS